MAATEIRLAVRDGVAWITLDGAETRNALDADSVQQMVAACEAVDADDSVGAVVVQGSGGSFCSGAHTSLLAGLAGRGEAEIEERLSAVYAAFARVHALTVPTVALVDGHAVGAGVNLAMACDLRLVTPRAIFQSGFARLGIHPGGGHFQLIARAAGYHTAAAMGVFAQRLDAAAALRSGLVWDLVAADDVERVIQDTVGHLAADPALARLLASSLRETWRAPWLEAVAVERARQAWTFARKQEGRT